MAVAAIGGGGYDASSVRGAAVPVKLIFRCQFCDAVPDAPTQVSLERQLGAELFGEYLDGPPSGWLTWTGRGIFGPKRHACPEHRGRLEEYLRLHYGSVGPHPWKRGPHRRFSPAPQGSDGARVIGRHLGWTL